jgi:CO/xanthine dehydrogenase Mo-binding subunit
VTTIGRSVARRDAIDKVTGRARYTADLVVPGALAGAILRSPHPHARLRAVDARAAAAAPGVVAVLTREDLRDVDPRFGQAVRDQPVLALDRVRFEGEPVAAVAAVDARVAEAAARLVAVGYEPLPALADLDAALAPGAPALHDAAPRSTLFPDTQDVAPDPARNVCTRFAWRRGDPARAFAEADLVVDATYTLPSVAHMTLEPHGAVARWEAGALTVWAGTQYPFALRQALAEMFGLPQSRVRVVVPYVGGAFGSRELMPVAFIAAALSRKARRPVRLLCSVEETARTVARHWGRIRLATAVLRDGTFLGRRGEIWFNTGAYTDQGPRVAKKGAYRLAGPYRIPHVEVTAHAVFTNTVSCGSYRGFGTPQVAWAYESQMDEIAERLGMDPVALRQKNLLERGEEYARGDRPVDSDLGAGLRVVAGWLDAAPARAAGVGAGVACAIKDGGGTRTSSTAVVRLHQDGSATVLASSAEIGQGVGTVLAQVAAEELALPPARVGVTAPDTAVTPFDQRTNASRATALLGSAVQAASRDVADQLRAIAAEAWGCPAERCRLEDGAIVADDRRLAYAEAVQRFFRGAGGELLGRGYYRPPAEANVLGATAAFWEIGIGGARVRVDAETGAVTLDGYVTLTDAGRAINPAGVEGQDLGGAVMGLGPALFEALVYDGAQLVNPTLVDYRVPGFADLPADLEAIVVEGGGGPGPHGAKGVAEGSVIPVAPAIANAVAAATGARIRDLPLTPERVWRALRREG